MDLRYSPEEQEFRGEVREFFRSVLPREIRDKVALGRLPSRDDIVRWQRILNARGWAVTQWAPEWGGTGWDTVRQYIFREEMYLADAPEPLSTNVTLVGPVVIAFGNEQQKRHFLPRIANVDMFFCQGFSEPEAGSDLAALRTRAVRDGDQYIVTGQKLWTSYAHQADWMFCLVRTDESARKQDGISYLLIDMASKGVTVKPVMTLDGGHHVNEVFLNDVQVPVTNRIGEENRGWHYAKFLLGNERILTGRIGLSKSRLRRARDLAARVPAGGSTLAASHAFREKAAALEVELKALEITTLRVLDEVRRQTGTAQDPKISILKIKGSELAQATAELLLEVAGPHALPRQEDWASGADVACIGPEWAATAAPNYLYLRAATIFGGSSEIQRNIVAKNILGI
ncbi:acyl-CoA dehydrogenase family protein [Bradyrhizobium sp. LHD-71]|uniref:acyl-CoA dehydrogenase family protein n=1 Tax=Bradyrhizobium sp. LHD-71 TaxID=3072141 RepID=UPI00280F6909|nr:acyl-CoA dehydrogenase family protein [Bradyrhizobium sp. LHD-71]MDQ8727415.1 acyl-CoA dehydrogenase family protein [Bradyrhizobium sp. LHD-71]